MGIIKKLKFICPIWKDPVGWSLWVAGNKIILSITILFNACMCAGIIISVRLDWSKEIQVGHITALSLIIFMCSSVYTYALYRLIKIIDQKNEIEDN